jgi:hypothetical protein
VVAGICDEINKHRFQAKKSYDLTLQLGKHFFLHSRAKVYASGSFFRNFIQRAFIPQRTLLCQQEEFAERKVLVLMGNCPLHVRQEVLGILAARVRIITLALHTTPTFQILDLHSLALLKIADNISGYSRPIVGLQISWRGCIIIFE